MSFTRTNEGRVFFKNADNDDQPTTPIIKTPIKTLTEKREPIMPRDNTQMQILMLLKSLNMKLKSSKDDQAVLKSEVEAYKKTIKDIESKTNEQQGHYIDLEQKFSRKQSEVSKKAERVESHVKKTLEQISEAKELVKTLEEKSAEYESSFSDIKDISKKQTLTLNTIKDEISAQKKLDKTIVEKQKLLEKKQDEQGEKMVSNVAAYVALTKRVSESEARHEALDNKIEDARSDYIKLDRKLDKTIEDRNRILRKVERIEQAVMETRDALNAKAMVLLTDQGAVAGVHMPQVSEQTLQTDPMVLNRRLQEEALMPWWQRPVRLKGTSLALVVVIVLLVGWIASSMMNASSNRAPYSSPAYEDTPTVSLDSAYGDDAYSPNHSQNAVKPESVASKTTDTDSYGTSVDYASVYGANTNHSNLDTSISENSKVEDMSSDTSPQLTEQYGITIHEGYSDPYQISEKPRNVPARPSSEEILDLNDEEKILETFSQSPEKVAKALNQIEPGNPDQSNIAPVRQADHTNTATYTPPKKIEIPTPTDGQKIAYIQSLKARMSPDKTLSDIAKKIETQAFQGIPEAQHDMGALYVAGHGATKQNFDRAIFWFTEASQNGIANAKYNLGVLNHQGMGVEKNIDRAMTLYRDAAKLGHPEAQYNLGIANIEGIGVPYNPNKAAQFFQQAADQGITEAAYNLGLIYENGLLGQPQPEEALTWYQMAADSGSPEAQSALEQLAKSLGIKVEDVRRIVDKVRGASASSFSAPTHDAPDHILISAVQNELMRRGLYPGPVDGKMGPMTKSAIENFEASANLQITGAPSQDLLVYLRGTATPYLR